VTIATLPVSPRSKAFFSLCCLCCRLGLVGFDCLLDDLYEVPAENFLLLEVKVLERAAGDAALARLDDGDVLRMDVAHRRHREFTGVSHARRLVLADPVDADDAARFLRPQRE